MNLKKHLKLPKIIGHRGVKNLAPENTLESIRTAFNIGLQWVEIDVKISKNNIPFLLHDDDLNRTTDGFGLACLYDYSYIKKLDAGKFFYKKKSNIYPPTLKEVLDLCKKYKRGINIELKPNLGLERKNVKEVLKISTIFEKHVPIYYSSFDINSCIFLKEIYPKSLCGIIFNDFNSYGLREILSLIAKYNFFSCGFNIKIINSELIKIFTKKEILTTVYSSKNIIKQEAINLWNIGVNSIFSDDPRKLTNWI